jgi:hypothetical protein
MKFLLIAFLMAAGYAYFFYRRSQVQKAGGFNAHWRAEVNKLFRLSGDEQITAAWPAVTVPKLGTGEKVAEAVGAVSAVVVGVGVRMVGRPLGIACTTADRVLVFDREADTIQAFGPQNRPRFSDAGKKGTKRPSQTRMGFDDGAILMLEVTEQEPIEIDIVASAVPTLVGWSQGASVAALSGPVPITGSI